FHILRLLDAHIGRSLELRTAKGEQVSMTQSLEVVPFPATLRFWAILQELLCPAYVVGLPFAIGQDQAVQIQKRLCPFKPFLRLPALLLCLVQRILQFSIGIRQPGTVRESNEQSDQGQNGQTTDREKGCRSRPPPHPLPGALPDAA